METKTVHIVYFSPAHSTRQIVRAVAEGISKDIISHDITEGIEKPIAILEDELVIIGVPSYSGRVPILAAKYLSQIQANGTPAIIVCVYGNREYDDTLIELKDICSESGFIVLSAGAFIARHSIFPRIAEERPDVKDLEKAQEFGEKSLNLISKKDTVHLNVPGNKPYRGINTVPLSPKVNSKCNSCGICATHCPVGAIDKEDPRKTDKKKCMACARCIELCPKNARCFKGILYAFAEKRFFKKYANTKEIELFFGE